MKQKNWKTFTIQGNNLTREQYDYINEKLTKLTNHFIDRNIDICTNELISTIGDGDLLANKEYLVRFDDQIIRADSQEEAIEKIDNREIEPCIQQISELI